jgi:GT2 family glycosyltransferase
MQCIESCNKLRYSNVRILVVDNGSSDGSEEILRERFPDIEIIQTGKNLGFAGGNNSGIQHALEQGADYIWVLNNDTIVDETCLDYLVQAAEAGPSIGMVGNKIYYHHTPEIIWYAGGTVDLETGGMTHHTGKDFRDIGTYDTPGPTGYITGCSILVRKETVQDIGLLDENYFLYFEDVDWSLRAKEKGWKLFFEPKAKLWHKEGAHREQGYSDTFIYYSMRNRLYFMKRFAPHRMLRCHLLQLKTMLFFMKTALHQGLFAGLRPLKLAALGYADFYFSKKMGMRQDL